MGANLFMSIKVYYISDLFLNILDELNFNMPIILNNDSK